ncbi:MAG TPA: TonB-dependent receptor [Vicinamibacterales bacterium]|nr:TonB-dependent receptor [Vicinamibacterales bacterium]
MFCGVTRVAAAQNSQPQLVGSVVDSDRGALPGVRVEVTPADGKNTRVTVTDRDGRFAVPSLAPGQYTVVFSLMNFAEVRKSDVLVSATAPTRLDVAMHVALNARVVVTAQGTFHNLAELSNPEENLVGVAAAASEGAVTARQIEARPIMRAGEVMETVPGLIASQHSGEGKANQYYLRGFNLDHGTDFSTIVAGLPVNLPSHAHGQGYSDLNFLIPELVSGVQYKKGPYDAREGDFSAAGSAYVNYANVLTRPIADASVGQDGWARMLVAVSPTVGAGKLLAALEVNHNDGPWVVPSGYQKLNGVIRYSHVGTPHTFSLTAMGYDSSWRSTDQVPERAIANDTVPLFGGIDNSDGGRTARYSGVADYEHMGTGSVTRATAYVSRYRLNLFSNFTYALDDPGHGDQFEQVDRRWIVGGRVTHTIGLHVGPRHGEMTVGFETRTDDVPVVGLYHTEQQVRLSTTLLDSVLQTSAGAFVQSELRWRPWLRTTGGIRFDGYRFQVRSDVGANSGTTRSHLASPKGGVILGPWKSTEIYVNAGTGFHSNDARGSTLSRSPTGGVLDAVTPLVRAKGGEVGFRTVAIPRVQSTVVLWRLDLGSELVFAGDAGTTEASRPSERYGIEWANYIKLSRALTVDADLAWSHARFTDSGPAGDRIPGSAQVVGSLGLTVQPQFRTFGSIRLRYFGPRPLIEDGSVNSLPTVLLNGQVGYRFSPKLNLVLDAFNLLNSADSDTDYFYVSRLPGEPIGGIQDIHTHPTPPRTLRLELRVIF